MLNTKEMNANGGKVKPVIGVGNNVVKINSIVLSATPYDKEAFNVHLNVETKPVKGDFQGFLKDAADQNSERYAGQVGRVRISQYPFKDTTLPSGTQIYRDTEILRSLITLSEALNKRDDLDSIEAETIEDFVSAANKVLCDDTFINMCVGGREWENNEGYINYDLYLPKLTREGTPVESLDVENSNLLQFDESKHVRKLQKKQAEPVSSFEPVSSNGSVGDDFDL